MEKQNRRPSKMASRKPEKVEIRGVWNGRADADQSETLHAGRLVVDVPKKPWPLAARAPRVN